MALGLRERRAQVVHTFHRLVPNRESRVIRRCLAVVVIGLSITAPHRAPGHGPKHSHHRNTPKAVTRRVFGQRWHVAWCISFYESRHRLSATNGQNLGPWQVNVSAHPWANRYLLTHSWRY